MYWPQRLHPRFFIFAILAGLALGASAALGADVSWTNASGGSWNNAANWSGGAVPGTSDNAIITLNGTYTVTLDVNPTVAGLTLGGGTGIQTLSSASHTLTVNGAMTINANGVLTLASSSATGSGSLSNGGLMIVRGGSSIGVSLTTLAGSILRLEGTSTSGTGTLTVASGFTNNGTIEMTSSGGAYGATLAVTSGSLVNAAGKALNVLAGAGGPRSLTAQLDNQGTVTVGQALTISKASADHVNNGTFDLSGGDVTVSQSGTTPSFTNTGTLTIASGRKLTVSGGEASNATSGVIQGSGELAVSGVRFTNAGAINPGTSPGILTITGNMSQVSTGALNVEIGGLTLGTEFDRVAVSGVDTLGGALNITRPGGFTPQAGDEFRVLTYGSYRSHFDSITGLDLGGGLSLEPRFDATGLTLVTVGQTWVYLVTGASPAPRDGHTAVYRPSSNRMIVFGGLADSGPLGDAWVLLNANGSGGATSWVRLNPTGGAPAARTGHTAVYDPTANRMVVYGGDDATGATPTVFGDVWVLANADGTGGTPTWSQLSPTGGPPTARTQHSAVFDAINNRMLVFGGNATAGACGGARNDVWILANANGTGGTPTWSQLSPTGGPPGARRYPNAAYDATNNRMLVFAGDDACGATNAEVWALDYANGLGGSPAWSQLVPLGTVPSQWTLQRAVFDPTLDRLTAFGGVVTGSRTNSVLTLTGANGLAGSPAWIDLTPTSYQPAARSLCSIVEDGANQKMIVFAGLGNAGRLSDTWLLEQTVGRVVEVPPAPLPTFTGFVRPPTPNPTRGAASFAVAISREQHIDLVVYDIAGRRVADIYHGRLDPGTHTLAWSGRTNGGVQSAAGIYLIRLVGAGVAQTKRVCVLP